MSSSRKSLPGGRARQRDVEYKAARTLAAGARRRLIVDANGFISAAQHVSSPNHDARPADTPITLIVVHGISLPPGSFGGDGIEKLFTNRLDPDAHPYYASIADMRVSAHFLIRRDGKLLQFVSCNERAWHAGASSWKGRERCNDFSIGIELEGTGDIPYSAAQYTRLAQLVRGLRRTYPIADIAGHSDVAPSRKTDPGPTFDWARLSRLMAPARGAPGAQPPKKTFLGRQRSRV